MKKVNPVEFFLIVFFSLVLVLLLIVLIFKKDWLDGLIYGTVSQEMSVDQNVNETRFVEDSSLAAFDIISAGDGSASVFLTLNEALTITGFELIFGKDPNLKITDFVCSSPFSCMYFESNDDEVFVSAIIPPGSVKLIAAGQFKVGTFEFSEIGNIFLKENSYVFSLEKPEINFSGFNNFVLR
jgi:hypothetical protein